MLPNDAVPPLRPTTRRALRTLAGLTVREAWGDRFVHIAVAVACFAAVLSLSCSEVAIFAHERVLTDGALTTLTLTPLLLSMAAALGVMERDIGERAASSLLAQPISLRLWLLGRFVGLWAVMVLEVAAMAGVFGLTFWAAGATLGATHLWAVALIPVECTLALCITLAARCMSQRSVAGVTALVVVAAGYLTVPPGDLKDVRGAPAMPLYRVAQSLLPQMQRINLRAEAARGGPVPESFVAHAVLYGMGYGGVALCLGALALQRRRGA